jgi:phosphoribosylaminoimidazolecarboxamide formyltransferase/IMP cyclohydrolase
MDDRRLALLSVSDKRGIETLARGLVDFGFDLLSTGGTAKAIAAAGLPVTMVSDYTGAPEVMDGRVKTLHPKIHGGILARDTKEHLDDLRRIRATLIDLVVVNLYPFEATVASRSTLLPEAVEQIDIGGPCLLRAAAKNFERVTAVCDPHDYETLLWHLARDGAVPPALRFDLAVKAFGHTAAYDTAVFQTLPQFDLATHERRGGRR